MSLEARLLSDMKEAMKAGDKTKLTIVRLLRSRLNDARIAKGDTLDEADMLQVLKRSAKQSREAIEQFEAGGRSDSLTQEQAELAIIESYLPAQLAAEQVAGIVDEIIQQTGASSMKDMGSVMGQAMARLKDQADGKLVQQLVREKLNAL